MFDDADILQSPRAVAQDADARESLRLVLEGPHKARRIKLVAATLACVAFVVLAGIVIWGWAYFGGQRKNPGFWHVALVSLLFWLGVTQGMVALSAILRITHASWRYPLNRLLDMASLFGIWVPLLLPLLVIARQQIYNLGSSEYRDNVWRLSGPVVWDALAVGTAYLAGWLLLYLTSLPDFAALRDRAPDGSKEQKFYRRLSWFWRGSERQWRVLRRAEGILVIGILTSFVGSQTVLGWDFQLAAARNWDSSIFAPLYTLGSLLGGAALSVLVMTFAGRFLRGFFGPAQFDNLGRFMVALGLVWFYFRFCDYLTAWYGHIPEEWDIQNNRTRAFPILAALMTFGCFVAPVFGGFVSRLRRSALWMCIVSIFVLVGVGLNRYLDTVPTFAPNFDRSLLLPTVPGTLVFLGLSAMFVLTYLLATRFFPIISWWGMGKERTRTAERTMGNATVTVMVEDPPLWET